MTTTQSTGLKFEAIGLTAAFGASVAVLSFASFGIAQYSRSTNIAPRCSARHPDTIYNTKARRPNFKKLKKDDDDSNGQSREEIQYRGNCFWGWIPWTLSLPYETLLKGVPGTGTRKGGAEGVMLKVNLDGVIMIKFHAMCLRVALLATLLCVGIALPINFTACFWNDKISAACSRQSSFTNLTNFEKTTLAAIPEVVARTKPASTVAGSTVFDGTIAPSTLLVRFYTIVIIAWLLYFYTVRLIQRQWIENLALRRVYYLEADHWNICKEDSTKVELNESDSDSDGSMDKTAGNHTRRKMPNYRTVRNPWVPHPELRDTVPNIDLFSVLVGNLPSSLSEILYDPHDALAENLTKKDIVEWQLKVTASFFDKCVPRPPGFSSSVAAVTILPDAPDLALAWRKWYKHAATVRKLRFVRSLLARMRHFEIPDVVDNENSASEGNDYSQIEGNVLNSVNRRTSNSNFSNFEEMRKIESQLNFFQNVFGSRFDGGRLDGDVMHLLDEASMFGPEQIAAYSRESSRSAAGCCPYGCCEERVREMKIDKLSELERVMTLRAEETYQNLKNIQKNYVKKNMEMNNGDSKLNQSLNLQKAAHRMSRLYKWTQKLQPPQIHIPKDKENAIKNDELSPGLSETSLTEDFEPDRKDLTFNLVTNEYEGRREKNSESTYLGVAQWDPYYRSPRMSLDLENNLDGNVSPRLRLSTDWSHMMIPNSASYTIKESQWDQVERLVQNDAEAMGTTYRPAITGVWGEPTSFSIKSMLSNSVAKLSGWTRSKARGAVRNVIGASNFAVVTFTSRQAAIAARNCLADGRGYNRFRVVKELPTPPLADAATCDIADCRGCCRPVTVTHSSKLQFVRTFFARVIIVGIYIFSTFAIQFVVNLIDLQQLYQQDGFGFLKSFLEKYPFLDRLISGFIPALLFSSFFAAAPHIFRSLSNFGSNAISINQAEFFALKYYWWFMLLTVFSFGSIISTLILNIFKSSVSAGVPYATLIETVLVKIANTLPTQVGAVWLNWIIFRTFLTLPLQYLMQINTFVFQCLGWKCCRRCNQGGGPGGPIPYRIYVDSGVVFLCCVSLSPVCPMLAPASALYFLFCVPLWRRNCIFIYRPIFDSGGSLWPFLADVCLTSMIFAQVFMTTMMALKKAIGPAVLAAVPIVFIFAYRIVSRRRFLSAYTDAALFQSSVLDCWDSKFPTSTDKREEYRKFLIDSHKAAYVPICMAVGETACLTAEPAIVIPYEQDELTLEGSHTYESIKTAFS